MFLNVGNFNKKINENDAKTRTDLGQASQGTNLNDSIFSQNTASLKVNVPLSQIASDFQSDMGLQLSGNTTQGEAEQVTETNQSEMVDAEQNNNAQKSKFQVVEVAVQNNRDLTWHAQQQRDAKAALDSNYKGTTKDEIARLKKLNPNGIVMQSGKTIVMEGIDPTSNWQTVEQSREAGAKARARLNQERATDTAETTEVTQVSEEKAKTKIVDTSKNYSAMSKRDLSVEVLDRKKLELGYAKQSMEAYKKKESYLDTAIDEGVEIARNIDATTALRLGSTISANPVLKLGALGMTLLRNGQTKTQTPQDKNRNYRPQIEQNINEQLQMVESLNTSIETGHGYTGLRQAPQTGAPLAVGNDAKVDVANPLSSTNLTAVGRVSIDEAWKASTGKEPTQEEKVRYMEASDKFFAAKIATDTTKYLEDGFKNLLGYDYKAQTRGSSGVSMRTVNYEKTVKNYENMFNSIGIDQSKLETIAVASGINLNNLNSVGKYKFYEMVADGLVTTSKLDAVAKCGGKSLEDLRAEYEQADKACYGDDSTVQFLKVEDFRTSQANCKMAVKISTDILLSVATMGAGTGLSLLLSGGTHAAMTYLDSAGTEAGVDWTSIGIDATLDLVTIGGKSALSGASIALGYTKDAGKMAINGISSAIRGDVVDVLFSVASNYFPKLAQDSTMLTNVAALIVKGSTKPAKKLLKEQMKNAPKPMTNEEIDTLVDNLQRKVDLESGKYKLT